MIRIENLSFSYEDKQVLKDINFSIKEKEKVVLLGINGSGKSTLLKILNGLIFPDRGSYYFKDELITEKRLKDKEFARKFRKSNVLLFQSPDSMIFNPTVYDEIAFGLRQLSQDGIDEKVRFWADKLGIYRYLDRSPFELSGGEKQKVCLASILVLEPELLLLDEPTANLDPRTTGWFIDFLSELDTTVITTTHNLSLAPELGERGIVLSEDHTVIYDGDINSFIDNIDLLKKANLVHTHYHRHGKLKHKHYHTHDF
ncbi:MAG TPA: ABC transporter ATP-binding protein [Persephonella sp.]|uniref:Cobalt import ATP-binding protein CbiO 1 n=1 Tax=Persephonella marina (strain DSM 14350 / EX-H1) TaxID=123214 RepID=C0QPW1_PERMH|nr:MULTISPECIES: ABC transporter ATP-binding protein [Persephonella]ACO03869.1 cobalt import ATP-binding protein CbiO 1 [Persephonella marina EX-H1]HCB69678.1 ABC transporter ATP-binding protein [Persephonella sp.]